MILFFKIPINYESTGSSPAEGATKASLTVMRGFVVCSRVSHYSVTLNLRNC